VTVWPPPARPSTLRRRRGEGAGLELLFVTTPKKPLKRPPSSSPPDSSWASGSGVGVFMFPSVIDAEIARQYGVEHIGSTVEVCERYYAISAERHLSPPAVVAVSQAARLDIFRHQVEGDREGMQLG
jgi:hypothetical protein